MNEKQKANFKIILMIWLTLMFAVAATGADLQTVVPAEAPGKELKIKKSGVPSYNIISKGLKSKNVPLLNVGTEATMQAQSATAMSALDPAPVHKDWVKPTPQAAYDIRMLIKMVQNPIYQVVIKPNPEFHAPDVKELLVVADPAMNENTFPEETIRPMNTEEEKLLQALIYLEIHKSYALATGLLAEIIATTSAETSAIAANVKIEAQFQYGRTALGLGIPAEHRVYMLKVLNQNKNKELEKRASEDLAAAAVADDLDLVPIVDKKMDELGIENPIGDQYAINRARYYAGKNDLGQALAALEVIKDNSKLAAESEFLKGILNYRAGKLDDAKKYLEDSLTILEKNAPVSELKSVAALTLARLEFQQGLYKEAFQTYLRVNRGNPLWMQAMIEQAWTQILSEDYEGASGNMYTLHTDFFKNAFAPDSYVARAVGYLNLCQYGDGAKAVYSLNHRYAPMKDMLEQYQTKNQSLMSYYETVRTFFKNPDLKVIDGLHRNFVYELARNPGFMALQGHINSDEDQVAKYNNLSLELLQWERNLTTKITEAELNLKAVHTTAEHNAKFDYSDKIHQAEQRLQSLKVQYQTAKRARNSIKELRAEGIGRIDKQKDEFKKSAAQSLRDRFADMLENVTKTLDQAEVLRYELYSGAGEHLRFQLAGGQITDKEREALRAAPGKSVKWDFIGEVWEDELGHFRSSLKNVCPKTGDALTQN